MPARKAAWPRVGELARKGYRLDQLNREVERVLDHMRRGAVLTRTNRPQSVNWSLRPGAITVSAAAARLITTTRADVVGCGDCLFDHSLSQTWRFITEDSNA
jgi:hypothetical protein